MTPHPLTALQANILRRLKKKRTAADVGVNPRSIHRILGRLEGRGFVRSEGEGKDRLWEITDEGRRMLSALEAMRREYREYER